MLSAARNDVCDITIIGLRDEAFRTAIIYVMFFWGPTGLHGETVVPGNIVVGTTIYEEIIATFGQPSGRNELDDRVILRYLGGNARTLMSIDMQTDVISRANLLMTDAALRRIIVERGGG